MQQFQPLNMAQMLVGTMPNPAQNMIDAEINQATVAEAQAKREALKQAVLNAQAQREREAQWPGMFENFMAAPNASNYARLNAMFPDKAAEIKESWSALSKEQQQNDLRQKSRLKAHLDAGDAEGAINLLNQRIEADRAAGEDITDDLQVVELLRNGRTDVVRGLVTYDLATISDPDKMAEVFTTFREDERAQELQPYEVGKADADIRKTEADAAKTLADIDYLAKNYGLDAAKLDLDRERLSLDQNKFITETRLKLDELNNSGIDIDPASTKTMNEAVIEAQKLAGTADQMLTVADKLDKAGSDGWGVFSTVNGVWNNAFGSQDAVTEARQQYIKLRNSAVINDLPPGTASDRDIAIFMEGWPKPNAKKDHVVRFLKGYAKINKLAAANQDARAAWISANGNLGTAKRDMVVAGRTVPAGTTYGKFASTLNDAAPGKSLSYFEETYGGGQ